jgi:hypothetical protein
MKKSILLAMFSLLFVAGPVRAATLADLPFGSVVQVMPTDTAMCGNANCTTTTNSVLPLKFVKMQARLADGTALGTSAGYSDSASFGDNNAYTYWMLLDNYCWWGSAQCQYNNGLSAQYQAYNGVSGTVDSNYSNNISMVMGLDNSGNANANAASMQNNNVLNTLEHFYDSLPANINNRPKANVIPNFTWDMRGNSTANPSVAGWYNAGTRPWQTGTYDPTASNGVDFTFTGTSTTPVMASRLGLASFTEWQGGTAGYSVYTGQTAANGSGGSFCQARFGTDCTNGGSYGLFGGSGASAANPVPRYPWLRSPNASDANGVWDVNGSSGGSLGNGYAGYDGGLSPVLWLSSDISTTGGTGTYASPYCINAGDCNTPPPVPSLSSPIPNGLQTSVLVLAGTVGPDPDGDTVVVYYQLDGTAGTWQGPVHLVSGAFVATIDIRGLTPGNHTIYVRSWDGVATSTTNAIVGFQVPGRSIRLTVMKNQAFNMNLGEIGAFSLTPGTVGGVTASVDGNNELWVSGTLAADTDLLFGMTTLKFQVLEVPTTQVQNIVFQ